MSETREVYHAGTSTLQLCYRCEHRATYLQEGYAPRAECKSSDTAVSSCYMYQPVRPFIMQPNKGDDRPAVGPSMLTARSHAVGIMDGRVEVHANGEQFILYWVPTEPEPE